LTPANINNCPLLKPLKTGQIAPGETVCKAQPSSPSAANQIR
jgi:hypothetical protein